VPLNVALIGAGNISETHARAAAAVPGVRIAAVHGNNAARAERLAGMYGATSFTDLGASLAHRPLEAVIIGSPSGVHAEQGMQAVERGLHVLVEKPIDVRLDRTDALVAAAAAADLRLGVLFQDRTQPSLARLRDALASGRLGRPLLASARVKWYRPPEYYAGSHWRGTWALDGGGALMNQGIHTVDLLLWLLGPIGRVTARTATLRHSIEVEDTALALLEFSSGALATLEATTAAYPGYARRVELTTTGGTVTIEQGEVVAADLKEPFHDLVSTASHSTNPSASSPVVADAAGHQRLIEDFVQAIARHRDPLCSGREGRKSLAVVHAVYESART
jgi:UDP-N-acetyl-2-amino-2-deoxyglucuronate dehydrogenase